MTCRHEWVETGGGYQCAHCTQTCERCVNGDHPTGSVQVICRRCLTGEQAVLDDIAAACGYWIPTPHTYVRAVSYDIEPVRAHRSENPGRVTIHDVPPVLASWADMWAEAIGEARPDSAMTYLAGRFLWAANNQDASAWPAYRREVRSLRHVARRDAGLLPKSMPAPCVHCGGTVVRDWAHPDWSPRGDGLSDQVRCTSCGSTWGNEQRWRHVNKTHLRLLPEACPEALVTMKEARMVWPSVPAGTWRQWAHRNLLTPQGWDLHSEPLYRAGDLAALVQARSRRAG